MQRDHSIRVMLLGVSALATTAGCQAPDEGVYVAANLRGDYDRATEYGEYLLVRAVPDNPEAFANGEQYLGQRELADGCPLDHVELPLDFALFGSDRALQGGPAQWRLLAWVTDDPYASWVDDGELYGTATFAYSHDAYFGYIAEGIVVDLVHLRGE